MYKYSKLLSARCFNQRLQYQVLKYCTNNFSSYTREKKDEWIIPSPMFTSKLYTPQLQLIRGYAKSKDKKKDKGKANNIQINENQLAEVINVEALKNQYEKSIESLKDGFIKNLSIRTNVGSIESLIVNFDGKDYTVQELGQVVRKNPTMTVVNMAVFPQAVPAVLKTIQKSGMNLNPQQDGTTIYIPVPKVTTEHRENLVKGAKQLFIKCRDSIKDTQVKYIKTLKKKQNISEDLLVKVEQQIIALADRYVTQAQTLHDNKCNELLNK